MQPPLIRHALAAIPIPSWLYLALHVAPGQFVMCSDPGRHLTAEVDDPAFTGPLQDVARRHTRPKDIAVGTTVHVWQRQHRESHSLLNVERTRLHDAEVTDVGIRSERPRFGHVGACHLTA